MAVNNRKGFKQKETPPEQQKTPSDKYKNKAFPVTFVPTGEVLTVKVISCAWNPELARTQQEVIQIDHDFFMSINHQNEEKPWLKYGFLKQNVIIIHNAS